MVAKHVQTNSHMHSMKKKKIKELRHYMSLLSPKKKIKKTKKDREREKDKEIKKYTQ